MKPLLHATVSHRPLRPPPGSETAAGRLPELADLERLIALGDKHLEVRVLNEVVDGDSRYPLYALSLGNPQPGAAVVLFCGGIHGVERIGTQLLLAQLEALLARLDWDQGLLEDLEHIRIVFCPLLNPVGMARGWRCNGSGVDLMRNAPQNAEHPGPWLLSGHRIGAWLPWYRGPANRPMQPEAEALCALIQSQIRDAPFSLSLDCHSGFGMCDRLWFPYAGSRRMLEHAAEVHAMVQLYERANPHHTYVFEPQCHQYRTHGDLWDYLYQQQLQQAVNRAGTTRSQVFVPLTLELGSWLWVRKNLRQITRFGGLFNPVVPHRHKRILRHHNPLFDFLIRATRSWQHWLPEGVSRAQQQQLALQRWYQGREH
jgi:hypothetical protein